MVLNIHLNKTPLFIHLLLAVLFFPLSFQAQHHCGFDEILDELSSNDPSYKQQIAQLNKQVQQYIQYQSNSANKTETGYLIPVVVHVLYANENADHNISDAQVESAIQRLNDIFADIDGMGVDTEIQFALAKRTPDCQPTNGIVRVDASGIDKYDTHGIDRELFDTDGIGADRLEIFNMTRWNPLEYLNIWVVNEISDNDGGAGVQAFATLPGTYYLYDGIVTLYNAFGYDYDNCNCFELKSYTDENKTLAHEVGHYLGLYHTFEGDNSGTSCPSTDPADGDQVADTPAHIRTYSCSSGNNTCYPSNDPYYSLDEVIHNYMGYASETCQYEFTPNQAERMVAVLETTRYALPRTQNLEEYIELETEPVACQPQTTIGLEGEYGTGVISVEIEDFYVETGTAYQDGGYVEDICRVLYLNANQAYSIDVTTFGFYNEDLKVYIDYNSDGSFDEDELILSSDNNSSHSANFVTPADPVFNEVLRLRLISDHYQFNINGGCYAPLYGQVEDYMVLFPGELVPEVERGQALQLDGIDDCLQLDFSPDPLLSNFTYEFWCKPEGDPSQFQIIFDRTPNDYSTFNFMGLWHGRLFVYLDKELLFMNADPLAYNEWHHIAYIWDGAEQNLYVNGKLVGEDVVQIVKANNSDLRFGAFLGNFLFFNGEIEEIRVWETARTHSEIKANMYHTGGVAGASDMDYYPLNGPIENDAVTDLFSNKTAILNGSPSLITSTLNTGSQATSFCLDNIVTNQDIVLDAVGLEMNFSEVDSLLELSITQQQFPPNTFDGTAGYVQVGGNTWTLNATAGGSFSAAIEFLLGSNALSDFDTSKYKLFHRAKNSGGPWSLIETAATAITDSSVSFSNLQTDGQLLLMME